MEVFRFGAERVRTPDRIKNGLLYEDERGMLARVDARRCGYVYLIWSCSGRQSRCKEDSFCRRFSLVGNGHKP